jgi:putative RNA 2'-phosphotransferase
MPAPVRHCPDHGYFEGDRCPTCDTSGRHVISGERRRRLSKFASGALRHFPGDAGLALDDAGWTSLDGLADSVEGKYDWADRDALLGVVATDPKDRFERDTTDAGDDGEGDGRDRIRAAYGHSVDVDLDATETPVPETLYHGTAPRNLDAIFAEGLRPMNRQQVHLSGTVADAREVGSRHAADPVVLAVDAAGMLTDGHEITKRGTSVYTTDRVASRYLSRASE